MAFKKATYTLPLEAIKQIDILSKRTGKTKSGVIADLIMSTETKYDKIMNQSVKLEKTSDVNLNDMVGSIKTGKVFDPVKIRDKAYLDRYKK